MQSRVFPARSLSRRALLSLAAIFICSMSAFASLRAMREPRIALASSTLVISQVYGGGGNSGATLKNDFIELFNRGNTTVSLTGWSVQYASTTGTTWQVTNLNGSIPPGGYYLVQEAQGAGGTTNLPTPDASGTIPMSGTAGKVALVNSTTPLSGSCPSAGVVDFVGFGTGTNCFEGAGPTPAPSNTTSVLRGSNGCTDTDVNSSDFAAGTPNPRNSATTVAPCGGVQETLTLSCAPASFAETAGAGASTCTVTRTGSTAAALTVNLASNDTSEATVPATATIPASSTNTTFAVAAVDDPVFDGTQTATITASATNFTSGTFQVSVTDNEVFTCNPTHTIAQIQGSGTTSPLAGQAITTSGIVTGLKSNGFYLQMPSPGDNNAATSDGIFVFTSSAPPAAVAVGNSVCVAGSVQEFITSSDPLSPPVTELSGTLTINLLTTGNALPTAVTLTSADTGTGGINAGSIENLERYEGMRVTVPSLTVVAPTQGTVTETSATSSSNGVFYGVITGVARPFREPGIQANDPAPAGSGVTIPPVPRFDFNPERLRVDSDGLTGAAKIDVTTGATITGLTGPLDYAFRTYTILPEPGSSPVVSGNVTFTAVPAPAANEFTVASFNMERFFDTVNDPSIGEPILTTTAFNNRLNKASLAIRNGLRFPDILGIEEMENLTTLQTLAAKINADAVAASQPNPNYVAYLFEGNDVGGIDVGFLVKTSIVAGTTPRVTVNAVVQEGKTTTYTNPNNNTQETLNDRPPLRLMAVVNHPDGRTFPITVIVVHQRSLNGIDDETTDGTGTAGGRVRAKRRAQAEYLANLIQARQTADPTERIICVGDFNAFEFNDGFVDAIGTVRGVPTPANQVVLASADLVNPDLTDLVSLAAAGQNYSYSFDGDAQAIDHELANAALMPFFGHINFGRLNADFPEIYRSDATRPERLSDHDPGVAYFAFPPAADLSLAKTHVGTFVTGATGQFRITVSNAAGAGATIGAITVSDTLPAGMTLASFSGTGWSCTGTTTLSCTHAGPLAAGDSLPVLTLTVNLTGVGRDVSNTATVATINELNTSNNSAEDLVTIHDVAPTAAAQIDDPLSCTGPGNTVSVTATVKNQNAGTATGNFTATLTPTLKAVPGSCTATAGACQVVDASTIKWTGSLAAGQTVTIKYLAQVAEGVLPGAQLCATSTATVGNSLPVEVTACGTANCPAPGPGALPLATSPMSDQKAGSVLIFNLYTSSVNPNLQNTRINLTNTHGALPAYVHLFFVDGASCSVADSILCLTPNQTTTFLASDLDPGTTGYLVAVAIDRNGCPTNFNYLIGDAYVKLATGHAANLGAAAVSALAGGLPACDASSTTATLSFDGISYNVLPRTLALDNLASRADGNDTLLVLNRIGGNLATGPGTLGTIFGLLYDDAESVFSFSLAGGCQLRGSLSSAFPRTTPRLDQIVPAGRTGWLRLFSQSDIALSGAAINFFPNINSAPNGFNQGHNLHVLTTTAAASLTIPVFPPSC